VGAVGFGKLLAGAALVLAALLAAPALASAAAGSDATIASADFTVPGSDYAAATAMCPSGRVAVGGGVQGFNPVDAVLRERQQFSSPVDETGQVAQTTTGDVPRGWTVYLANISNTDLQARVYAVCSATSDARLQVFDFVPGFGFNSRLVECSSGRAIGGGMGVTETPGGTDYGSLSVPVDSTGTVAGTGSGEVPTGWLTGIYTNEPPGPWHIRAMAVCSVGSDATTQVAQFQIPDEDRVAGSATATCPGGRRALSGGVAFDDGTLGTTTNPASGAYRTVQSGPRDTAAGTALSTQTGDVARAWFGEERYLNGGSSPDAPARVIAVCTKDPVVTPPPSVDKTPPQTTITSGPKPKLKKGKPATFDFTSSEAGSHFECRLDDGPAAACTSPVTLRRPKVGKHVFSVAAIDKAGNRDASPATYSFKVKKKRKKHRHKH